MGELRLLRPAHLPPRRGRGLPRRRGDARVRGEKLAHLHLADSFNFKGSGGLRYILNPPGTPARIHQHLDIGQGEVDWDAFFTTLRRMDFDGIATVAVFAWDERAHESSAYMLEQAKRGLLAPV
ncbi:hypothetical protein GCM10029992_41280 [Glycomyces albus]